MSVARSTLIERLRYFRMAANEPILIAGSLTETDHNEKARILRNGLAVIGFALLEDFLKSRTAEVLKETSAGPVRFEDLPQKLQEVCTINVVNALKFQSENKRRNKEDAQSFIQGISKELASTTGTGYQLSYLSFGHDKSNINSSDIKELLSAFNIEDPWTQVDKISSKIGLSLPSHLNAFTNIAKARHKAAHKSSADIPSEDLKNSSNQILAIAISFDIYISHASNLIRNADKNYLQGKKTIKHSDIQIRFIDSFPGGIWKEIKTDATRATRTGSDPEAMFLAAVHKAKTNNEILVMRDSSKTPLKWLC